MNRIGRSASAPGILQWWYLFCSCTAILVYLFGLGSQYIPKNGDEYVYVFITRLTAQSKQLLPLSADTQGMGYTKPPLLFLQGLISTRWTQAWTLTRLRWPNTMYTMLTAMLVALWAWRIAGTMGNRDRPRCDYLETGITAALMYLAFFSTYRYGRPFLTNAPEVFWTTVCFTPVLWRASTPRVDSISWPAAIVSGCAAGLVLLYKSFARLSGKSIGVPYEFNAGHEGYRFLLPAADIMGYPENSGLSVRDLAARYPFFVVTVPVQQTGVTCLVCNIVDQRLCLHTRHSSAEIRDMLHGNVFRNLFKRELLVSGPLN